MILFVSVFYHNILRCSVLCGRIQREDLRKLKKMYIFPSVGWDDRKPQWMKEGKLLCIELLYVFPYM